MDEDQLDVLTHLFNKNYETGNFPSDWLKSTFVTIPKIRRHVLVQKCKDMQTNILLCFIDYEKAFDRVKHQRLLDILMSVLDGKDLRVIRNLYAKQVATVRVENVNMDEIDICRGVRQGCVLSSLLFNIYSEALEDLELGVKINRKFINNLRYADDTFWLHPRQVTCKQLLIWLMNAV